MGNEKSRERLTRQMQEEVTRMFEQALDYAQVACPKETYAPLRSKILRAGNNCIRNLSKQFQNYDIQYVPRSEEIIEFQK
jgi:hypothetical protein